ncbi:MAG: carboxylate-amine ligase [Planctomycetota bacterium]
MSQLKIGIEEEYMLVDPKTLGLSNHTEQFLSAADARHTDNMKAEFHTAVVEIVTDPCADVAEAKEQLTRHRRAVIELAEEHGLGLAAAGTHPTTHWKDVKISGGERYAKILYNLQDIARANLIYGMHCHVEILDPEARIQVMNAARYFLPHLLALSGSSPFWQGKPTGHMSTRSHIFKRFPRTGIPDYFNNDDEFRRYVDLLVTTGCIDNAKMIYWDIRPHPFFPTVEFRICDTPTKVEETLAIVSLLQAIVHKLLMLYEANLGYRLYRRALINENVYRAARYGLEGKLIDFQKKKEIPTVDVIRDLLAFLADDMRQLGTLHYVEVIEDMLVNGNSAQRQLARFKETNDPKDVIRLILEETKVGVI